MYFIHLLHCATYQSLLSFSHHRYSVLQAFVYSHPWQSPPTIFQLSLAVLRRQHHITFYHRTVSHYLFTIKTVSFFMSVCFSQHELFLLDFSEGSFCKILRTFNVEHEGISTTWDRPTSLHRLCTCKPSASSRWYTADVLFFRHSRWTLYQHIFEWNYFKSSSIILLFFFPTFFFFVFTFVDFRVSVLCQSPKYLSKYLPHFISWDASCNANFSPPFPSNAFSNFSFPNTSAFVYSNAVQAALSFRWSKSCKLMVLLKSI